MAITNAIELAVRRRNTLRFIEADLTIISLVPNSKQWVDGTLKFVTGPPRDPQKFKLIWAGDTGMVREVVDAGGVRHFDFTILGEHDATIAIGDTFDHGGNKFVVEYLYPDNGYEVKAGGTSHGSQPT